MMGRVRRTEYDVLGAVYTGFLARSATHLGLSTESVALRTSHVARGHLFPDQDISPMSLPENFIIFGKGAMTSS